jgi:hypothetical protein
MALTMHMQSQIPLYQTAGSVTWPPVSGTVRAVLLTAGYTYDQDNHITKADLTVASNELAAGGDYVAGGGTVTNPTKAFTAAGNITTLDGDDVAWTNLTGTVRYVALVNGTASTSILYGVGDFGANQVLSGVGLTITWAATGIFVGTVAP